MVSVLVKSFGGAPPALVFPRHRRVPGREVAQQGPGTTVQSASLQRAVQVLALIEVAVHASHQSVKHVARAVAAGVAVGNRPAVTLATQVQDLLQDDPCEVSGRPLAERAQALCKTPAVGRVIGIPNPPGDFGKHLFKVFGPVADLEPAVQEAQQDDDLRKQHLPGRLRPLPAIGADGLGSVFGGDIAGLVFEDLVGDLQLVAPCRLGRFRSQAAPVADGRGDVDLLAVEPLMMLVGQ